MAAHFRFICLFLALLLHAANSHKNKYSAEANNAPGPDFRPLSLKELDKPFRMAKLNLLWTKAKLVSVCLQTTKSRLHGTLLLF